MSLKENVNRIHINLLDSFESVKIYEKDNIQYGNYIELSITEGNKEVKAIISKRDLESYNFTWRYHSNPIDESSNMVIRNSSIDGFINDVKDIFEKNRFNYDYIQSIK
jgi:hypothetical protein